LAAHPYLRGFGLQVIHHHHGTNPSD
jgi:hypothetical protein